MGKVAKKRSPTKRNPIKRSPAKKSIPKKRSPVKRSPVKRSPVKKSIPKRRSPSKRSPVKRSPVKRSPVKKSIPKRRSAVKKPTSGKRFVRSHDKFDMAINNYKPKVNFTYDPSVTYVDLAKYIFPKVKKIEGPVTFNVLKPTNNLKRILGRNPPLLLMIGDIHVGNESCFKCIQEDGCYTLYPFNSKKYNFISILNDIGEKYQVDLFLENWYNKAWRKTDNFGKFISGDRSLSALEQLDSDLAACSTRHVNVMQEILCPYNNINVHFGDPRKSFDDQNVRSENIRDLYDSIDGLIFFMKQKNFSFKEFAIFMKQIYPQEKISDIIELLRVRFMHGMKHFFQYMRTNKIMEKYSKVHKQIRQLPNELQDIFYKFNLDTIMSFEYNLLDEDISELSIENQYNKIMEMISKTSILNSFWLGVSTVDLYSLSRALKTPTRGGLPSQLSVFYFGNKHISNMITFLVQNELYELSTEHSFFSESPKCLKLNT